MNENPPQAQSAIPSQTPYPTPNARGVSQDALHKLETAEGESYTMKCICNFSGDDGSTIYCEPCETWQHIGCFYPDNREEALRDDFTHFCHDCKPRPLDRERAVQRVQRLRDSVAVHEVALDKKPKKPSAKSHKKKTKPNELQINGTQLGVEQSKNASPSDPHPPAKKAKTSHRPSQSISSQAAKRSPSYGNARPQPNGHPPSPATTPPDLPLDFEMHAFSPNLFSMYNEEAKTVHNNNTFEQLQIPEKLSQWLRDPDQLQKETRQDFKDVFRRLPADIEARKPTVRVEQKTYSPTPGTHLRLRYLAATTAVEKDAPLLELNGQIGFQATYCADPANMWGVLNSPLPFVFFHPRLPLCIDTRTEGSEARYVRRSCKPNAMLDTFLSGGTDYHFWLVSDRPIAAKDQITLGWDFRFPPENSARMLHLLGLGDDEVNGPDQPEMEDDEYQLLAALLHRILSEYGGCACELGSDCAFVRFHRHYIARMQSRAVKKKSRKLKALNVSPTSTGQATNSRAPSEGRLDDGAEADARSTSRSKPPSRDRTPLPQVRQGSFDQMGILTEPTDRDKRKVAMVEDSFRRMEQAPPRKKKRVSDGTAHGSTAKPKSARSTANSTPNLSSGIQYVDAGTSRSLSGSPAISPSAQFPSTHHPRSSHRLHRASTPQTRLNYCDASVQTDPVEGEWFSDPHNNHKPRRRIISLSQRLLNSRHQHRKDEEERRRQQVANALASHMAMDADSPVDHRSSAGSPVMTKDTISTVATSPGISTGGDAAMLEILSGSPTSSVPGLASGDTDASRATSPAKLKTPDLRVQMPPLPLFNNTAASIASATTPVSASLSVLHSPFSTNLPSPFGLPMMNGIQPSPVKKKLSLSDYRKRTMDKAAAGKPLNKDTKAVLDEAKPAMSEPMADSPTVEKASMQTSPKELSGH
jgi:uncharacterized protein